MSILKKFIIIIKKKTHEFYKFEKSINFSIKKRSQKKELSEEKMIKINK